MHQQVFDVVSSVILVVACSIACVSDLKSRRIPNYIPIAVFASALPIQLSQGWTSFGGSLLVCFAMLGVGTLLFSAGWMGGGDIKLLAAGMMILGMHSSLTFLFYTAMSGGVLGLISLASRRNFWGSIKLLAMRFILLSPMSALGTAQLLPQRVVLPYAIALTSGAVINFLADTTLQSLRIT